ncbi:MAG: chemotaxis protein CheB [Planctomycetota bacterium]
MAMKSETRESKKKSVPEMIIVVGASAGGFKEIALLVEYLPAWFKGTMIVANHRLPHESNDLAKILADRARVRVHEPVDDQALECTTIYVGKPNETIEVDDGGFDVRVNTSNYARVHRIDDLFKSVADTVGKNAVGVILSGMLSDGIDGLEAIQQAGGYCIVQCPEDAQYDSMPKNAIERIEPDFIGTTREISSVLMELAVERFNAVS